MDFSQRNLLETFNIKENGMLKVTGIDNFKRESFRERKFEIYVPDKKALWAYLSSKVPNKQYDRNSNPFPNQILQEQLGEGKFAGYETVYTFRWKGKQTFHSVYEFLQPYGMRPIHQDEDVEVFKKVEEKMGNEEDRSIQQQNTEPKLTYEQLENCYRVTVNELEDITEEFKKDFHALIDLKDSLLKLTEFTQEN